MSQPNLVLIGFMGTGKSTIGRECAEKLGFAFRDTDACIERRAERSIAEIFEHQGEPVFRGMESATVRHLANQPDQVISTGGGVVLKSANIALLRRSGIVILLWAKAEEIAKRCSTRRTRPLLTNVEDTLAHVTKMLDQREEYYFSAAHAVVDTTGLGRDRSVDIVLSEYRRLAEIWPKIPPLESPAKHA
ncbi:MAG: shikimate kinase [Chthonomonadales bacterium]